MSNTGEDFLKELKFQQEDDELRHKIESYQETNKKLEELEEIKETKKQEVIEKNIIKEELPFIREQKEDIYNMPEQELGDIVLSEQTSGLDKKNYIYIGIAIIISFLVTLFALKVINSNVDILKPDNQMQNESIDKQYQQIIQEQIIREKEEQIRYEEKEEVEKIIPKKALDIEALEKKVVKIEEPKIEKKLVIKVPQKDPLDIIEKTQERVEYKPKPVEVKPKPVDKINKEYVYTPKRKEVIPPPEVKDFTKKSYSKPNGFFIQIGSFSKSPTEDILSNIKKDGLKYKVYKTDIGSKIYYKLLIGPYSSRSSADKNLANIRKKLNAPDAFILKF